MELTFIDYGRKNKKPTLMLTFNCSEKDRANAISTKYNLKQETDLDNVNIYLDFEFGLFDILDDKSLNILEEIWQTSPGTDEYKYINKEIWENYVKNHPMKVEKKVANGYIITTKHIQPLYEATITSIDNPNEGILYKKEILDYNDLLYTFLGFIFSVKNTFSNIVNSIESNDERSEFINYEKNTNHIVKKCKYCGKFMIASRPDYKSCNRKNNKFYTCRNHQDTDYKKKYLEDFVHKIEKNIRDLYQHETSDKNLNNLILNNKVKFQNEYPKMRKNLSGKEYLYWLVEHYERESTQNKWKLKIDAFLKANPNFENDFKNRYYSKNR